MKRDLQAHIRSSRTKRRRKQLQTRLLVILSAAVVIGAGLLFYLSQSKFHVQEVRFSGLARVNENDIRAELEQELGERRWFFFPRQNLWFIGTTDVENALASVFSAIQSVSLKKDFPSTLHIEVMEYARWGVFCMGEGEHCMWIDQRGVAFENLSGALAESVPRVYERNAPPKELRTQVIESRLMEIANYFEGKEEFKHITMTLVHGEETVRIQTKDGWDILLLAKDDYEKTYRNVRLALDTEIKDRVSSLQYIDARVGNKLFYKFR